MAPESDWTATGKPDTAYVAAEVRAEREYGFGPEGQPGYLRMSLGLGVFHQWQDAHTETGAGDYSARIAKAEQTFATLHPVIEVGGRFTQGERIWMPYAKAGGLAILGVPEELDASLVGVPNNGPGFKVGHEIPGFSADLGFGLEGRRSGLSVQVGGGALLSGAQQNLSAHAGLVWTFREVSWLRLPAPRSRADQAVHPSGPMSLALKMSGLAACCPQEKERPVYVRSLCRLANSNPVLRRRMRGLLHHPEPTPRNVIGSTVLLEEVPPKKL